MAKNRVIYQSEALFAGQKTGVTDTHNQGDIKQIHRVQSANYSFNISRTDVNQFGELAAIDRVVLDTPTVSLDFSYLLANFANEENLGFFVNETSTTVEGMTSALSGVLNKTEDERNYFIQTSREGEDAVGDTSRDNLDGTQNASTIGIGNGFLTSYSTEASVGGFPTVSISVEGMNMNFSTGTQLLPNPGINRVDGTAAPAANKVSLPPVSGDAALVSSDSNSSGVLAISTLRPGDITIKVAENDGTPVFGSTNYSLGGAKLPTSAGDATDSANIQSYNISFDLGRTPIQRLGNRFAFAREVDFPVSVGLSFDAILTDLTTGNLNDLIDCEKSYNVEIELKGVTGDLCGSDAKTTVCKYVLKDMKPDSQSFSSSIGDNKSVTLDFSTQIGGPRQTDVGLFMAGITQTNNVDTSGPTFNTLEVTSADQYRAGTTTGQYLFDFNESVTFGGTRDLTVADFSLFTGIGDGTAVTSPFAALTHTSDYVLTNNILDKTFILGLTAAGQTKLNVIANTAGIAKDIRLSGFVHENTQDSLGNSISASGDTVDLQIPTPIA